MSLFSTCCLHTLHTLEIHNIIITGTFYSHLFKCVTVLLSPRGMLRHVRPQGALCPLSAEDCGSEEAAAEHLHHSQSGSVVSGRSRGGSRLSALKCLHSGGRDGTRRPDEPGGGCSGPGERLRGKHAPRAGHTQGCDPARRRRASADSEFH